MKMNKNLVFVMVFFAVFAAFFTACKKDDAPVVPPVDKSALKTTLDSSNVWYTKAVEGVAVGTYEVGSKTTFKTAIDAAQGIYSGTTATTTEVANANVNLGKAGETFKSKRVAEIAPEKLVAFWKFNGDVKDASGNKHDGTLTKGHAFWGAGMPTLTKDRYGVANMAYHFDKGGNIEVPFATSLNPAKEMTISLWVKSDSIWDNSYLISLSRWNGFKLNLQGTNKVFFTVHTADDKFLDRDNASPELAISKWYHVVVTFKSGEMVFYVNGTMVKTWTDTPGDFSAVTNTNLTIGQDLPTSKYTLSDKDPNYLNWGGFFKGDMDDVRMYNAVLTSTQVTSIYNAEKP